MDDDLNADNIPVHDSEILRMSCGSTESDACELIVTCKPHYNVRILGACIVCEARTIECYSKTEGYIQSCRGDAVAVQDHHENDEEQKELYHSRLKFENPESEIRLKVQYLTLTLCIRETPKRVLLQIVKTQMKCRVVRHFIWVYSVCKGKKDFQTK